MSRLQTPIRKNDNVLVVSGKDRGKRGRVLRVVPGERGKTRLYVSLRHLTAAYSTSGASEMIFMNRRSRSSRETGPNTRVPIGSP